MKSSSQIIEKRPDPKCTFRDLTDPTVLIGMFCLIDLISTIWLVETHGAAEANPIMQPFLACGTMTFILAKAAFSVFPLLALDWARRHKPAFVRCSSYAAAAAYLLCYVVGVTRANAVPEVRELPKDAHVRIHEYRPASKTNIQPLSRVYPGKAENCNPLPSQCL